MEPFAGGVNTPTQSEVLGMPALSHATVIQSPDVTRSAGVAEMLTDPAYGNATALKMSTVIYKGLTVHFRSGSIVAK